MTWGSCMAAFRPRIRPEPAHDPLESVVVGLEIRRLDLLPMPGLYWLLLYPHPVYLYFTTSKQQFRQTALSLMPSKGPNEGKKRRNCLDCGVEDGGASNQSVCVRIAGSVLASRRLLFWHACKLCLAQQVPERLHTSLLVHRPAKIA